MVPRVYCTEGAPLSMADGTPLYLEWIIEGEDGKLYVVPAEPEGWLSRVPYTGQPHRLVPVCPQKAEAVVRLTSADLADLAASAVSFGHSTV